ncbi:MAG: sporulation protein YunB [Tumebacillaceae bacterium]
MAMRVGRRRGRVNVRFIVFALLVLFLFTTVQGILYVDHSLRPALMTIAEAHMKEKAAKVINDSITARISQDANYNKLINFREGAGGKISAGYFDLQEATRIQQKAVSSIQDALNSMDPKEMAIPMGMALDNSLLSQIGPNVPVKVTPHAIVKSNIGVETRDAGINQSVHILYLDLQVEASVIIPFSTKETVIATRAPLAYLWTAGDVPQVVYNAKGEQLGTTQQVLPPIDLPKLGEPNASP